LVIDGSVASRSEPARIGAIAEKCGTIRQLARVTLRSIIKNLEYDQQVKVETT
jgi:predicted signal transduction protein with EAL and GGDEF domain